MYSRKKVEQSFHQINASIINKKRLLLPYQIVKLTNNCINISNFCNACFVSGVATFPVSGL